MTEDETIEAGIEARLPPGGMTIRDFRGHYRSGRDYDPRYSRLAREIRWDLTLDRLDPALLAAFRGGALLPEPIAIPPVWVDCPTCDKSLEFAFDGLGFVVTSEPCEWPDTMVTETELNVPSGRLVVANDLRRYYPVGRDWNVNAHVGCHQTTLSYAAVGLAHGFVGNSCPALYRAGPDRFVVGNWRSEVWDGTYYQPNPQPGPWGQRVAGICTDLWWYSLADEADLRARAAYYTPGEEPDEAVVAVRPGVYRIRHDQMVDRDASIVKYATLEWVREPDTVRDWLTNEQEQHRTATEVLMQLVLSWPSLYMVQDDRDDREDDRTSLDELRSMSIEQAAERWRTLTRLQQTRSLALAADSVMVTIGSGHEWHENGFPRVDVDPVVRQAAQEFGDVPAFDFPCHWYPISPGHSSLCLAAGVRNKWTESRELIHLSDDFVRLALNVCQAAIRFGEQPRLDHDVWPPAFEVPYARERMALFAQCYRAIRERYPAVVFDQEFDRWMAETDIAQYAQSFDFGPDHPPESEWGPPPLTVKTGQYFEFDTSRLTADQHFCRDGCWSKRDTATHYGLRILRDGMSPMGHLWMDGWPGSARESSAVPLRTVGRVVAGTGDGHRSLDLVVEFDYGTETMRTKQWALRAADMPAVRQFDDPAEYRRLLEQLAGEGPSEQ